MIVKNEKYTKWALAFAIAFLCLFTSFIEVLAQTGEGRFGGYEIRSIRRKYMTKTGRMELGAQGTLIMNQPFIYTLMASGILDYHFTEMFAIELSGSYGVSVDKEDKRILKDEFDIQTQILRTAYMFSGGLLWTPVYGKTQLPSGRLVYFDSFFHGGVGMTGVAYDYEQCIVPDSESEGAQDENALQESPAPATFNYLTLILGLGQKFFLDKDMSLRWDVRENLFAYEQADGSCDPQTPIGSKFHHNITLQIGASSFF